MKYILLFTSLLFFNINVAQTTISNIEGNWINFKTEMKDGSRLYTGFPIDSINTRFVIGTNKFCMNMSLFSQLDYKENLSKCLLDYKLIDNVIQTSQYSGYIVERFTADSLTLCEKINDTPDEKLKRLYLVREETMIADYKEKYKNQTHIVASSNFTPKIKESFMKLLNEDFNKHSSYYNLRLSGRIIIFPKEKKVKTEITNSTRKDAIQLKRISNYFNNSFEDWDLKDFMAYESVELPFVFEVKKIGRATNILFFTNDVNRFDNKYGITLPKMAEGSNYFKKAIQLFQEKKFLSAADFFEKSFEADPRNIDALYNKAASYAGLGDKENTCKVWKQISDLGQVNGKELYLNNCQ